jgi:hypothetical protein
MFLVLGYQSLKHALYLSLFWTLETEILAERQYATVQLVSTEIDDLAPVQLVSTEIDDLGHSPMVSGTISDGLPYLAC